MTDCLRLLLQPLRLQGRHPGVYHQPRQVGNHLVAGRITVGLQQLVVMRPDHLGHVELHLRQILSPRVHHIGIDRTGHVEHHIVIAAILVVAVQIPVRRLVVNLHIPHPEGAVDIHLRIEEIGTCIVVVQSGVNHFDELAVGCLQFPQREHLVLPHIMQ